MTVLELQDRTNNDFVYVKQWYVLKNLSAYVDDRFVRSVAFLWTCVMDDKNKIEDPRKYRLKRKNIHYSLHGGESLQKIIYWQIILILILELLTYTFFYIVTNAREANHSLE